MINYILFTLFVLLQFGDAWTTIQCINQNKGHEANGFMAYLFSKIGMTPTLIITKVGIEFICGISYRIHGSFEKINTRTRRHV